MYYKLSSKKKKTSKFSKKNINIKKRIRIAVVIILILSVVLYCVNYYIKTTRPLILKTAESNILAKTTMAVNQAVLDIMSDDISYSDLITVEKNTNGEVTLIEANSILINNLARQTAISVQQEVDSLGEVGVSIPIGTLSGLPLLTGRGSEIKITVQPINSVVCTFRSEFVTAGINQTLHQIYLEVNSDVTILLPTLQKTVNCDTPVLVSESIIVGKVPDTFLQGTILGSSQSGQV